MSALASLSDALLLAAILGAAASGLPGLFAAREGRAFERLAAAVMVGAGAVGTAGALLALAAGGSAGVSWAWSIPGGAFETRADALSALLVIQVFVIAGCGAVYGLRYFPQAKHPDGGRKLRAFFGLATAGIALLGVAQNAMVFLLGWEVMTLSAFLLLTTDDRDPQVRRVGYVYMATTRVGTLCLFAAFALLYSASGSFRFAALPPGLSRTGTGTAMFVLGALAFGVKAGVMPLHLWLPGAHASAPSHVSALFSGVVIKTGIYGLLRLTSLFADPPAWWGGAILAAGVVSGVGGVAFAIGQHDLKRLLAYHSVENIGIICLGLGLALWGRALGRVELVALGVAGAVLHVLNHGLFKGLLFLSAGSVVHAAGTREIDLLGGLLPRMRWTGLAFVTGAVAICGLPPLNGFVSELFIYLGAGKALALSGPGWMAGVALAAALALIGGLALACFTKVFGAAFLGEPRSAGAREARESPKEMLWPMGVLAGACAAIGLFPSLVAPALDQAARAWAPELAPALPPLSKLAPLQAVSVAASALLALCGALWWWLQRASRRAETTLPTWDCGYAAPTPRMQYTASSFGDALVGLFAFALRPRSHRPRLTGPFPSRDAYHSEVPEVVLDLWVRPAISRGTQAASWLRWMQQGSVQSYLLYVLAALLASLLLWS